MSAGVLYAALVPVSDPGTDKQLSQDLYENKLKFWTDSTLDGKVNRVAKFVKEKPQTTVKAAAITGVSVGTGALIGGGIGAGVGFLVANFPGIPVGAAIGGGIGAAVGLIAGTAAGAVINKTKYIQWKGRCRYEDLLLELMKRHQEDTSLNTYCCPLTLSIFEDPVMIPSGTIYERSAITACIKKGGGEALEPLRSGIIKEEDLYEDHATRGFILIALEVLFRKDLKNQSLSNNERIGLNSFLRDLDAQIATAESLGRKMIKKLKKEEKISGQVYKKYQTKLNELIKS